MEGESVLDNVQNFIHFLNISWKTARPYGAESTPGPWKDIGSNAENSSGPFPGSPSFTVSSTGEEYRHIVQERCTCGGVFVPGLQVTGSSASGQFEVINAACVECGILRQFNFSLGSDINGAYPSR